MYNSKNFEFKRAHMGEWKPKHVHAYILNKQSKSKNEFSLFGLNSNDAEKSNP